MCTLAHECLLFVVEEIRGLERFWYKEDATKCPYYCNDALDDIKPECLLVG
jgi:hypothetical protein